MMRSLPAYACLAETAGIFAETAGGVTVACAKKLIEVRTNSSPTKASCFCITGHGLKTQEAVHGRCGEPRLIKPSLREFEALVASEIERRPSPPCHNHTINPMPTSVRIPTPLRKLTKEEEVVPADGKTISEILASLEKSYPGLAERICDEQGNVRRFVNIFLNDEDIRFLDDKNTAVKEGDEISIVPAIAGG